MTIRQKILQFTYKWLMKLQGHTAKKQIKINKENIAPSMPFYALKADLINGSSFDFATLQGKKVMLVNVASACGFTAQYAELEALYRQYPGKLVVLGFPANDFNGQEPGADTEIASFCKVNFGITFPLFKKQAVLKPQQNAVYAWLTDAGKNGWNKQEPTWNFCKYLVDDTGKLRCFFPPAVSPLSDEVIKMIA